jgi:uncharacterized secreted protein with C-terminal beta-propeller domain
MKMKGSRRLIRRLGLALAVAAVFAPSAQAMPLDVPPRGLDSVQTRQYADDIHVATPVISSPVRLYADDLHAPAVSPVAEPRGYAPINTSAQPEPVSPVKTESAGIDWGNPAIGAGALFVLLGLGGVLVAVRHTRRGRLAAV